ncbi:hypothetical protein Brms1b_013451 [Colletotrichum noveboracense]|nr:hypothetical protein Brms1b_013451 [Colletotrichum noveboracense]
MVHGYYDESVFERWAIKNADKILALWPDVKKHGIWIVTDTYSTAETWIATWSDAKQQVSLALSGGVEGGNVRVWGDVIADASTSEWHGKSAGDLMNSRPRNILAEATREERTGADLDEKHIKVKDHQGELYEVRVEFISPRGKWSRQEES